MSPAEHAVFCIALNFVAVVQVGWHAHALARIIRPSLSSQGSFLTHIAGMFFLVVCSRSLIGDQCAPHTNVPATSFDNVPVGALHDGPGIISIRLKVAKDTHGFVGADIAQLCMEAALACIAEKVWGCQKVDGVMLVLDGIMLIDNAT